MTTIHISEDFRQRCPQFVGTAVVADVHNSESSPALWDEIDAYIADYRRRFDIDSIKQMPPILATRQAYRACGKDPSRYRPSSEALVRRTLQGHDLYRVNTIVDLINLASIAFGYSIGGFDADMIQSQDEVTHATPAIVLTLGIGREGEPYEGIGRGSLNIAGLPVYRDIAGGIGTPTSDNERTKLTLQTRRLLAIVNGYDGDRTNVMKCAAFIQDLLRRFAASDGGETIEF